MIRYFATVKDGVVAAISWTEMSADVPVPDGVIEVTNRVDKMRLGGYSYTNGVFAPPEAQPLPRSNKTDILAKLDELRALVEKL